MGLADRRAHASKCCSCVRLCTVEAIYYSTRDLCLHVSAQFSAAEQPMKACKKLQTSIIQLENTECRKCGVFKKNIYS